MENSILFVLYTVAGYFPLGPSFCIVWASADVLLCTASIWHMATMSIDRYVSIRFPLKYNGRARTRASVVARIAFVWIVSVLICAALPVYGIVDYSTVYSASERQCVPALRYFVVYGSIFAFYIPLVIMIVTYALTVLRLRQNALTMPRFRRLYRPEGAAEFFVKPAVVITAASAAMPSASPPSFGDTRKEDSSGTHHQLRVPLSGEDAKSINGSLPGAAESPRVYEKSSTSVGHRQVRVETLAVIGRAMGLQATRSSPLPFSDCCSSRMEISDDGVRDADDDTETDSTPEKYPSDPSLGNPSTTCKFDFAKTDESRTTTTRCEDVDFSSVRSTLPSSCGNDARVLPECSTSALRRLSNCRFRNRGDGELESPLLSEHWPTLERRRDQSSKSIDSEKGPNNDDEDVFVCGDDTCVRTSLTTDSTERLRSFMSDCSSTSKSSARRQCARSDRSPTRFTSQDVDEDRMARDEGGNEKVNAWSRTQSNPLNSSDHPRSLHAVQPWSRWVVSNKIGWLSDDQRVGVTVAAAGAVINIVDAGLSPRELDTECDAPKSGCSSASLEHQTWVQSQTNCSAVARQSDAADDDRLPVLHFVASPSSTSSSAESLPVVRRHDRDQGVTNSSKTVPRIASAVVVASHPMSSSPPIIKSYSAGTIQSTPTNRRYSMATTLVRARRQSSRQSRASLVLGVMFSVFVLLWSPFFIANLVRVACSVDGPVDSFGFAQSNTLPTSTEDTASRGGGGGGGCLEHGSVEAAMTSMVWLGYTSSLANPVIYTIFSASFRAAFHDILTCRRHRTSALKHRRFQIRRRKIPTSETARTDTPAECTDAVQRAAKQ